MRSFILFICSFCMLSFSASAQNKEEVKIKTTLGLLFTAINKADTAMMRSAFSSSPTLHTVSNSKTDGVKVFADDVNDFIFNLSNRKAGDLEEAYKIDAIKIDGDLAQAWVPYSFYYTGKFLHCGVNALTLVRLDGNWQIQSIIDTRREEGCVYKK